MNVLILENNTLRIRAFRENLIGALVTVSEKWEEASSLILSRPYKAVFVDGGEEKGVDGLSLIEKSIGCAHCWKQKLWVIHSLNQKCHLQMLTLLSEKRAKVISWKWAWADPDLYTHLYNHIARLRV